MDMKTIKLRDFEIGGDKLTIIAGPCAAESQEILDETAKGLKEITKNLDINFIFKSSLIRLTDHLYIHIEDLDLIRD